jgi:hypothetical protein
MRRIIAAGVACLSVGAIATLPALADNGPSIHGEGYLTPFEKGDFVNHFVFALQSSPDGSNLLGMAKVDGTIGSGASKVKHDFAGRPICMKVVGNQATFVIAFDKKARNEDDLAGARFWVADNGKDQRNPTDTVLNDRYNAAQLAGANCDDVTPPRPPVTITKGDVRIDD